MKFGHFDDKANREYVITTPQYSTCHGSTISGSNGLLSLISNTGGGYSFYKDAKLVALLRRYRYNNIPVRCQGGRYFYINDDGDASGIPGAMPSVQRQIWIPMNAATVTGYTRFPYLQKDGIWNADLLAFVPVDARRLRDQLPSQLPTQQIPVSHHNVSLFSYVEFCLWNAVDDIDELPAKLKYRRSARSWLYDLSQDRIPRAPQPLLLLCCKCIRFDEL
ncbi:MAG: hypothetical protein ACLTX6_02155 [Lachnospiraceae bacterium]